MVINLSEKLFYHENYIYIEYGQLWLVSLWDKNLKEPLAPGSGITCGAVQLLPIFPKSSIVS